MKFSPCENYNLISPLKPEEAIKKLAIVVVTSGPATLLSASKADKYYQGKLAGSGFKISRIIGYRNSFRARSKGRFRMLPVLKFISKCGCIKRSLYFAVSGSVAFCWF